MKITLNRLTIPESLRTLATDYLRKKYGAEVLWADYPERKIFVIELVDDSIHHEKIGIAMIDGINEELRQLLG